MVRKITSILACMLLLLCAAAATASAESVYEGTISTTFLTIAEDINLLPFDDYVFFRSGQYEYKMLVGDIEYNNKSFSLVGNGKIYIITQVSNGSYGSSNYYSYSVSDVSSYNVSASDKLVYSNLGDYPALNNQSDLYSFVTMFLMFVVSLCVFIRPLFNFVMRNRKGSV